MKILAIETSCDETSVSIIKRTEKSYTILAHRILSQIDIHKEYGGVFPALAKRAHAQNLPALVRVCCEDAGFASTPKILKAEIQDHIRGILEREPESAEQIIDFLDEYLEVPIDALAVTYGPGLEPALWVGINIAKSLAFAWGLPLIPVNHMEGHIVSAELTSLDHSVTHTPKPITYPALALLISGGHTEFIYMQSKGHFTRIGVTRDDAIGEAFDKVARMLALPYPGGPEIEKIAQHITNPSEVPFSLPRPMLHSDNFDMSFSGLKTAVLYLVKEIENIDDTIRSQIAYEFQSAIIDVLLTKLQKILKEYPVETIIVGGGVSANTTIRDALSHMIKKEHSNIRIHFPIKKLATDNALMIAYAAYDVYMRNDEKNTGGTLAADGNLSWD